MRKALVLRSVSGSPLSRVGLRLCVAAIGGFAFLGYRIQFYVNSLYTRRAGRVKHQGILNLRSERMPSLRSWNAFPPKMYGWYA